jgi:glycerol-3-phosphate acyltransferase PlsY
MDSTLNLLIYAVLGYLLGSVPFAVIVSRAFRLADPRSFGSGNPGATNVLRSGSKAAAALTLIGDAAKGWLAMFIATRVGAGDTAIAWPDWPPSSATCSRSPSASRAARAWPRRWACCSDSPARWPGSRRRSGSASWCSPAIHRWRRWPRRRRRPSSPVAVAQAPRPRWWWRLMCAVLIYRHKSNIGKLLAGTESRIGGKKR